MKLFYILSIFIVLIPFLGIPNFWKTILFVLIGLSIFTKTLLIERFNLNLSKEKNDKDSSFKQNSEITIKHNDPITDDSSLEKEIE